MKLLPLSLLLVVGCATQEAAKKEPVAPAVVEAPKPPEPKKLVIDATKPLPPGLDEASLNTAADPCTDFYEYACGGWIAKTEIPADQPIYSRGFVSIADRNELNLRGILEEAAAGKLPTDTAFAKQLGDTWGACMDEAKLEKSVADLKKYVDKATAGPNLASVVGKLHADGFHPFFSTDSMQDMKNATEVIAGLDQAGLGLPDRDYYLEDDARKRAIREAYVPYVEKMFTMYGQPAATAKRSAEMVMALETRLAKVSQTRVERRDPDKLYHRIDRKGLIGQAGGFDWATYFKALGGPSIEAINVTSPPYFVELAAIAKDTKPEVWKTYLTWVVMRGSMLGLPKAFQDEAFAFASKNFSGAKEDRARWKKCVSFTDRALGEALGREFVRRYFGDDGKARTSAMVESLQRSFEANLTTLPWMDEPTRNAALVKVQRMVGNNKIGFPSKWRDYATLKTTRDSFVSNQLEAARYEVRRQLGKIGKPLDRTEWIMSPPTVNAYYEGQMNEIVFPAGILQPPFFNREASDAVNFGSMGMVVGHELTHGFDDEGRKFDADGNLKDWWSEGSGKAFVERASCVKKQFDDSIAIDDIHVKGDLTLGENVADLGGLKLAHAAMERWYAKKEGDDATKYRYSLSQQFFLGFAQSWCTKARPELARLRAATDPHAPAFLRVRGPLGNLDAFKAAWQCTDASKMVRTGAARCAIW